MARDSLKLSVKLAAGAAIALAALSGIGVYLGPYSAILDFLGQLALQAGIAAALLALVLLAFRAWRLGAASAITAALALGAIAPHSAVPPCTAPAPHRIVFLNVWDHNPDIGEVVRFLSTTHADALVLAEVTPRIRAALAPLAKLYPYKAVCKARWAGCDLVAYSRVPLAFHAGEFAVPSMIDMTLLYPDRKLELAGIHLPHAWPLGSPRRQRFESAFIARRLGHTPDPKLVVGDFNAATWSPVVARIAHAGDLSALTSKGTWRTNMPWPLRIPIDQALVGPGIKCASKSVSGRLTSDHRAVIVDFTLEPAKLARAH